MRLDIDMSTSHPCSRRTFAASLLSLPLYSWSELSRAVPPEISGLWPQARLQGHGSFTYFGLSVYQAALWVSPGFKNTEAFENQTLALELQYQRSLEGEKIAQRSLEEMQKISKNLSPTQTQAWLAHMQAAFPNVKKGDRLTGLYRPGQSTQFFFNGRLHHEVLDGVFAEHFFGIWLSPKTSAPGLRKSLLGLAD
jgi:hypothetical protein